MRVLEGSSVEVVGASWSPDGKLIAYGKQGSTDPDIYLIARDASGQREITFSQGTETDPTWSETSPAKAPTRDN